MSRVFIVGVGRSGTSLLQSIIASHPKVVAIPETGFLRRYAYAGEISLSNLLNDKVIKRCPKLIEHVNSIEDTLTHTTLLEAYKGFAHPQPDQVILDKDPRLIEYVSLVLKNFPDSKIIHIYRDPRDVIVSKKKASWSAGRSLLNYLVASKVQLNDAKKLEKSEKFYSVKYEDLITEPEQTVQKICDFLMIEYSAEMLNYSEAAKRLVHKDELDWKKETFEPIKKDNTSKWLECLTPFEALCSFYNDRQFIECKGYQSYIPNVSILDKLSARCVAILSSCIATAYKIKRYLKFRKFRG